jgi:hypothetical protein
MDNHEYPPFTASELSVISDWARNVKNAKISTR